jgi:hypothetical protein
VALVGLICIGLMGLAGVLFYTMSSEAQEEVAVLPTPTPIPPTPSPTSTQTATPTETPLPTPTGTPVIPINGGEEGGTPPEGAGEAPTVEPDATRVLESTAEITDFTPVAPPTPIATTPPTEEMPGSGGVLPTENGILIWVGLGLMVLLIIGVSNHFRNQST